MDTETSKRVEAIDGLIKKHAEEAWCAEIDEIQRKLDAKAGDLSNALQMWVKEVISQQDAMFRRLTLLGNPQAAALERLARQDDRWKRIDAYRLSRREAPWTALSFEEWYQEALTWTPATDGKKAEPEQKRGRVDPSLSAIRGIVRDVRRAGGDYMAVARALDASADFGDSPTLSKWTKNHRVLSAVEMARKKNGTFKKWVYDQEHNKRLRSVTP